MSKIKPHIKFSGVYIENTGNKQKIYTKNLDKGKSIYGEKLISQKGNEYREWNPFRSKLAATILKDVRNIYFEKNSRCLYLGASSGTTVSHLSDILIEGIIYAVEFAPRSIRELIQNCENRKNVISILADANFPKYYSKFIFTPIDIIYEDVAQPNQVEIGITNCKYFLKDGGIFIIAIKARSIDVTISPSIIYENEINKLKKNNFDILETINIAPYSQDHLVVISRYFE
ncbi:MAG: fibrillarin-like rRNA/tRNA 2'-O-methyltransferase [Promethearchaeota archaeon]